MLMAIWNLSGSDACSSPKSLMRVVFPSSRFVIHAWGRPAQERMSVSSSFGINRCATSRKLPTLSG